MRQSCIQIPLSFLAFTLAVTVTFSAAAQAQGAKTSPAAAWATPGATLVCDSLPTQRERYVCIAQPMSDASRKSLRVGPTSLDTPAWVQAIGSVLAILVTAVLAGLDGSARRKDQTSRFREQMQKGARFAKVVARDIRGYKSRITIMVERCKEAQDEFGSRTIRQFYLPDEFLSELEHLVMGPIKKLADIPIESWHDPEMALMFYRGYNLVQLEYIKYVATEPDRRNAKCVEEFVYVYTEALMTLAAEFVQFETFLAIADAYTSYSQYHRIDDRHEIIVGGDRIKNRVTVGRAKYKSKVVWISGVGVLAASVATLLVTFSRYLTLALTSLSGLEVIAKIWVSVLVCVLLICGILAGLCFRDLTRPYVAETEPARQGKEED